MQTVESPAIHLRLIDLWLTQDMSGPLFLHNGFADRVSLSRFDTSNLREISSLIVRNQTFFQMYDMAWVENYSTPERVAAKVNSEKFTNRLAIYNLDKEMVGFIDMCKSKREHHTAYIGYFIDQSHTHRGYAAQALAFLVDSAHKRLGITTFKLEIARENLASIKTALKVGFRKVAEDQISQIKCDIYELQIV